MTPAKIDGGRKPNGRHLLRAGSLSFKQIFFNHNVHKQTLLAEGRRRTEAIALWNHIEMTLLFLEIHNIIFLFILWMICLCEEHIAWQSEIGKLFACVRAHVLKKKQHDAARWKGHVQPSERLPFYLSPTTFIIHSSFFIFYFPSPLCIYFYLLDVMLN